MNNKNFEIGDLRSKLFAQMERLEDPNCDLEKELKKADAFVSIGNVMVNSAKVEVDFLRAIGGGKDAQPGTGFIPSGNKQLGNGE
jgi:hypothetical protein